MNQLKSVFGLPATLSHGLSMRGSPVRRSAGNDGRDPKRSREIVVAKSDGDNSPDARSSGRSYAKLIADYSREIEDRNTGGIKCRAAKGGFFSKTQFDRMARVSSLVRLKYRGNNAGPNLSTKSSSRPPGCPTNRNDKCGKKVGDFDEKDVLRRVTERPDWLDHVVHNHTTTRSKATEKKDNEEWKNLAHPLVLKAAKSAVNGNSNGNGTVGTRPTPSVNKLPDKPKSEAKNLSITITPLTKLDIIKNKLPGMNSGDKNAMLVTVTEESKSTATSLTSSLGKIDLRINGKSVTGMDAVISRVEKLAVVSSAERIEITIPDSSSSEGTANQSMPISTINLCIPNQSSNVDKNLEKATKARNLGSEIRNVTKIPVSDSMSKIVPWWTTLESFRRGETETVAKISDIEDIIVSEAVDTKVEGNRPREDSRTTGKATDVSKMCVNELRKKSEERRDIKVKSTVTNDSKKRISSKIVDGTMSRKSDRAIGPTFDGFGKKIEATENNTGKLTEEPRETSMPREKKKNDGRNDNLSSANSSIPAKPIVAIGKNNNNRTDRKDGTSPRRVTKAKESLPSKMNFKPRQEVDSKSEIKPPRLPRTYGNIKLLPTTERSSLEPVNRSNVTHRAPIKPNDGTNDGRKTLSVKNPTFRPIEKKKDGTLIDYGLTVSTRKKCERKLPDSRSAANVNGQKSAKKETPEVIATIKEVIPKRNSDAPGSLIDRSTVDSPRPKKTGAESNAVKPTDPTSKNPVPRINSFKPREPTDSSKKIDKNPKDSTGSKTAKITNLEKELLYSVWLRHEKRRDDNDPDSNKDPGR